ncbi:hypothetical protein MHYP_G00157260 [Metynnis hypsauchen]
MMAGSNPGQPKERGKVTGTRRANSGARSAAFTTAVTRMRQAGRQKGSRFHSGLYGFPLSRCSNVTEKRRDRLKVAPHKLRLSGCDSPPVFRLTAPPAPSRLYTPALSLVTRVCGVSTRSAVSHR